MPPRKRKNATVEDANEQIAVELQAQVDERVKRRGIVREDTDLCWALRECAEYCYTNKYLLLK